jgi:hypothetical protein
VFREEIRKVGGDTALEGVFSVSKGTREALSMSVAERRRRRIAQESFWSFPEKTRAIARPACCRGSSTSGSELSVSILR